MKKKKDNNKKKRCVREHNKLLCYRVEKTLPRTSRPTHEQVSHSISDPLVLQGTTDRVLVLLNEAQATKQAIQIRAEEGGVGDVHKIEGPLRIDDQQGRLSKAVVCLLSRAWFGDIQPQGLHLLLGKAVKDREARLGLLDGGAALSLGVGGHGRHRQPQFFEGGEALLNLGQLANAEGAVLTTDDKESLPAVASLAKGVVAATDLLQGDGSEGLSRVELGGMSGHVTELCCSLGVDHAVCKKMIERGVTKS